MSKQYSNELYPYITVIQEKLYPYFENNKELRLQLGMIMVR